MTVRRLLHLRAARSLQRAGGMWESVCPTLRPNLMLRALLTPTPLPATGKAATTSSSPPPLPLTSLWARTPSPICSELIQLPPPSLLASTMSPSAKTLCAMPPPPITTPLSVIKPCKCLPAARRIIRAISTPPLAIKLFFLTPQEPTTRQWGIPPSAPTPREATTLRLAIPPSTPTQREPTTRQWAVTPSISTLREITTQHLAIPPSATAPQELA